MEKKQIRIESLYKWLIDFKDDSPYADVNLVGNNEDYVRGFIDGLQEE